MERNIRKKFTTWDYSLQRKKIRSKWTECSCGCGKEYKRCYMWELFYREGCGRYYTEERDYFSCDEYPTEKDIRKKLDSMEKYNDDKHKQKEVIIYQDV